MAAHQSNERSTRPEIGDVIVAYERRGGATTITTQPWTEFLAASLWARTTPQITRWVLRIWWNAFTHRLKRVPRPEQYETLAEWVRKP